MTSSSSHDIPNNKARELFLSRFDTPPTISASAPGRLNLIGEHTDYNDGYVFPVAIDRRTSALFSRRKDDKFVCHSTNTNETITTSLSALQDAKKKGWFSYVAGVASLLADRGIPIRGTNCLITSTIPMGSGLSSSAALEVSVAMGLLALSDRSLPIDVIIRLCQKAEQEWAGVNCGIMDQFVSARGTSHAALLIDCRSLEFEKIPVDSSLMFTVCDTKVPHRLSASQYNARREECERAVAAITPYTSRVRTLRDLTFPELQAHEGRLDELSFKRARHVISENERVLRAVDNVWYKQHDALGKLLNQSHESLRSDYNVSSKELDVMAELCQTFDGVWGARMVGAGFGGSVLALSTAEVSLPLQEHVATAYKQRTGIEPDTLSCRISSGARVVRLS
jgi:galactokinase